jgi:hypothetical protein
MLHKTLSIHNEEHIWCHLGAFMCLYNGMLLKGNYPIEVLNIPEVSKKWVNLPKSPFF